MPHFFIVGDKEDEVVPRRPAFSAARFHQAEQSSHAGFVVQMAGLDVSAGCHYGTGIKRNEVANGNA
ncbi:hypothetical protein D3C74_326800 [compost metagenome]